MIKNTKKVIKRLIIAFIVVLIFVIFARRLGLGISKGIEVTTNLAKLRTIIEVITVCGKIQPEIEVKISSDVSGEIIELNVKEGDYVKKGQILVKVKPDIYETTLNRIEANLESTRASLENSKFRLKQVETQFYQAEQNYIRYKQLYEKGEIAKVEFDTYLMAYNTTKAELEAAKQNIVVAEHNVKSNEAALTETKANLTTTVIYAPVDGIVSKLNVKIGERVIGTMQMAETEILRIADFSTMEIVVDVSETQILRIHKNDTAHIEIDAYPNEIFKGIVTATANSPTVQTSSITSSDQISTHQVHIRILNPQNKYKILPGMSATVNIFTNKKHNLVSLPIQAVVMRPDSLVHLNNNFLKNKQIECIFKVTNNKAIIIPIKTGIQDNKYIEIISGIKNTDIIITGSFNIISKRFKNNELVKIINLKK
ncbi:MAG: efflux RND transporter periplasmic adaptor subunit [Bacteroidales bacterium]|nr:efflux RND transporter periplasmic adaptor subunit [Bacteroidales bacterium]